MMQTLALPLVLDPVSPRARAKRPPPIALPGRKDGLTVGISQRYQPFLVFWQHTEIGSLQLIVQLNKLLRLQIVVIVVPYVEPRRLEIGKRCIFRRPDRCQPDKQ